MTSYKFATDSEVGEIDAKDFEAAKASLDMFVPQEAIDDGAWGWVEDTDGDRYEIGDCE